MDRRAALVTAITVLSVVVLGLLWWGLSVPTDVPDPRPVEPTAAARPAAAPDVPPAPAADDDPEGDALRTQQLGPLPGLAGRDGTDPEVRAEVLDHIEDLETERLGAEEAARRRAVREQMLDKRAGHDHD